MKDSILESNVLMNGRKERSNGVALRKTLPSLVRPTSIWTTGGEPVGGCGESDSKSFESRLTIYTHTHTHMRTQTMKCLSFVSPNAKLTKGVFCYCC